MEREELRGYISHIIYRNSENGYMVFEFANGPDEVVCVGNLSDVDEGETLRLEGTYVTHPVYGEQFKVDFHEPAVPDDELSVMRYLGSGMVKGVGPALAKRIVEKFKGDTLRIIEEEPERLSEIKGISDKKAREIAERLMEKKELRKAVLFLQDFGISNNLAMKIHEKYGTGLYAMMRENPYRLIEDIDGIGFKKADEIAIKIGIRVDSDYRIRSGIIYTMNQAVIDGNLYIPREEVIDRSSAILDIPKDVVETHMMNLCMDKKLVMKVQDGLTAVYRPVYYNMELKCAKLLHDLDVILKKDGEQVEKRISVIEKELSIDLEDIQREAVKKAVMNGITIITGGPGTGKTTIINAIIRYYQDEGMDILLAAPTGRAAKRMSEATGYEASTIQRMLHLRPGSTDTGADDRSFYYEKNEDDPLSADVVIIDEMSMVDISLFTALLKSLVPGTRLIMVGDTDQLPSVGPGTVLKDLIDSGVFECVRLRKIFRQSEQSDIVVNAHRINNGEKIALDNKSSDFFFMERNDVNLILKNIILLIRDKLPKFVGAAPYELQVLTPMRKGILGVESLNPILQKYLNPPDASKKEKEYGDTIFREGDKVMQIKNDYQLVWEIRSGYGILVDKGEGIFNGDTGVIVSINDLSETVTVEYDGSRRVDYTYGQLNEIELAYAVTIHKSQGSQYPAVIIPVLNGPRLLFNRNLLYTGVTRAEKCVTLIGNRDQIYSMIENTDDNRRYTGMTNRIKEVYGV
ncbi:MAG: ATP-dependent RecD-like DNA helicase [Lachnospiraceae bacterium]|nr:ATP-dependent RecD-like DNA helicase [Lachnospiraceae bacterium]